MQEHIEIQHNFIKEKINKKEIEIAYVGKHDQQINISTKPFGRVIFITMHLNLDMEFFLTLWHHGFK